MANTNNFYQLKKEAAQHLDSLTQTLEQNPKKRVSLSKLVLEFQNNFGFGETVLRKMLKPYIDQCRFVIHDEHLQAVPK